MKKSVLIKTQSERLSFIALSFTLASTLLFIPNKGVVTGALLIVGIAETVLSRLIYGRILKSIETGTAHKQMEEQNVMILFLKGLHLMLVVAVLVFIGECIFLWNF